MEGILTECPICFEMREDVEVLEHWQAIGDISSHKMCGRCREICPQCPFCRDVIVQDRAISFVFNLVDSVSRQSCSEDNDDTRDERAELWQQWEVFEMEYEAQPAVVRAFAKQILEDETFAATLEAGIQEGRDWLRDAAGIVFRLFGMAQVGELRDLDRQHSDRLARAVEAILEPFERVPPVPRLNGSFFASVYMQAVLPWACAVRSRANADALHALVRRVGAGTARRFNAMGIARRIFRAQGIGSLQREYVELATIPVWGSQAEDLVWQTFYGPLPGHRQRTLSCGRCCPPGRELARWFGVAVALLSCTQFGSELLRYFGWR